MGDRNNSSVPLDNLGYWDTTTVFISYQVLLPIFVIVGLLANILSFCVWMFGPKSKSMCCAIYFAANSTVDFLFLTELLLWNDGFRESDWLLDIPKTDVTCKLFYSLYMSCAHLSTCISAIITVERSLTILFPLRFKCQDMRRRSKCVTLVIVVLQPIIQSIPLYYMKQRKHSCQLSEDWPRTYYMLFSVVAVILIPLIVIVVFNLATVAMLFKLRHRRNTVSLSRSHANAFTKLTIMTGVSFVLSYTYVSFGAINMLLETEYMHSFLQLNPIGHIMSYFNCLMNPVICLVVCKSTREDIIHFMAFVTRKIKRKCICKCKSTPPEASITNVNNDTRALGNVEFAFGTTETILVPNIGTTSDSRF